MMSQLTRNFRRNGFFYLMMLPLVGIMAALYLYPVVYSIYLSFLDFDYAALDPNPTWIGIGNFVRFFNSPEGRRVIANTFVFTITAVLIETVLGLIIALAFNRDFVGKGVARAMILVPVMMAPVIVGYEWRWLYNDPYGLINYILVRLHLIDIPIPWITSANFAMPSLVIADIWYATPFVAIILMGGLQSLPQEPYDSAVMDGAGTWQQFRYITLPLLRPVLLAAVLIRTMDAFQTFDLVFILTYGGPGNLTEVMNTYTYKLAFTNFDMGYAAAVAVISLIAMVALSFMLMGVIRRNAST